MDVYSKRYYANQEQGSLASAKIMVPIVVELVRPRSVIDIGCGVGTWLSVFKEHGADIHGYDGAWVKESQLHIPKASFQTVDLTATKDIGRTSDLATCLEVAEHLPASAAGALISTLTKVAPVVLFSAAIPLQGGTHHVNEQWPQYWAALFRKHGYVPFDCIRKQVWNTGIEYWYAQNSILYVDENRLSNYPALLSAAEKGFPDPLPLVHPSKFLYVAERYKLIEPFFRILPGNLIRAGKRMLSTLARRS